MRAVNTRKTPRLSLKQTYLEYTAVATRILAERRVHNVVECRCVEHGFRSTTTRSGVGVARQHQYR